MRRKQREVPVAAFNIREVDDPALFAERLGITPEPKQAELLRARTWRLVVNCARQWGKSTMMAIAALHRMHFRKDYLVVVLSPSGRQSALFVDKMRQLALGLGVTVKGDGQNEISLAFPNGSKVVGLPNSQDKIRGFSGVDLLIVDEASRVEDSVFRAVQPMTDRGGYGPEGGDVVLLSTPAGRRGFFWEAWAHGGTDWARVSVPVAEFAVRDEKALALRRKEMGERMFRQEYCCEFLDTEDGVFREDWITGAVREDVVVLGVAEPSGRDYEVKERTRMAYVGVDLGDLGDPTAIAVVERAEMVWPGERDAATYELRTETHYRLRHLERLPLRIGYEAIVRRIRDVTQLPGLDGRCVVVVDASGVGQPVVGMLRRELLGAPLAPVTITGGRKVSVDELGWKTPRVELLESLGLMLEKGELRIAAGLEGLGELQSELRNLKRRVREAGVVRVDGEKSGVHDDLAMVVALGCWQAVRGNREIGGKGRLV